MQNLIADMSLPSEIQSHTGLRARSQEVVGGGSKGRPRQEMQQGILLYHVADTQTERDETVTRDRGSGWSCDFGQRGTADIPFLSQNKFKKTNLMNRGGRGDCKKKKKERHWPASTSRGLRFRADFPLVQWCVHIPASAHKWPV